MIKKHIILVGCSNISFALLKDWLQEGISPNLMTVISTNNWQSLKKTFCVKTLPKIQENIINQDLDYIIIFAIKPQIANQIIPSYKKTVSSNTTVLYSKDNLNILHETDSSKLFNMIGKIWWVNTALSGSGIVYFFDMINSLAQKTYNMGLDEKLSY
ncbi:MAG: hypothetical protein AB8U25_01390 [Rickettsiales endosymbiont of Dermacentor nuttalli]